MEKELEGDPDERKQKGIEEKRKLGKFLKEEIKGNRR